MTGSENGVRRLPAEALRAFVARAFEAVDMPPADAADVARLMVEADLSGFDGHGVFRLPQYVARIKAGGINLRPDIRTVHEADSTALVDGDNGFGHLVVQYAARRAMDKAAARGMGWAGIRRGNHAGAASTYAAMPLERDMVGLYGAVGSANHMPPWGGTEMLLSTNPIAMAIPAGEEPPVVIDFATSATSYGKVKTMAQQGGTMPEGWMVGRDGKPLTDPKRASEGFLVPIGEHKGYGLALVIGLLAGTLNGAAMGADVIDFNADQSSETNTGQFIAAISVEAFGEVSAFKARVDAVSRAMRGSPTLPGVERVHVPGDGRAERRADYGENGVPVHEAVLGGLAKLAGELGITALE